MRITDWLDDLRMTLSETNRTGHTRSFLEMAGRLFWANARLRLGMRVEFPRSVVAAADACEAEENARGEGGSVAAERWEKCRATGDRAGIAFWRAVSVYSVLSIGDRAEKIRIVDG